MLEVGSGELQVVVTPEHVSVTLLPAEGSRTHSLAVAEISTFMIPRVWMVNRVLVDSRYRGLGHGTTVLQEAVRRVMKKAKWIFVNPGGYGVDPKKQFNFYRLCGFKDYDRYTLVYPTVEGFSLPEIDL